MRTVGIAMLTAAALVALGAPVGAEEIKTPITAVSIMNLLARPMESQTAAFDQSLRDSGPTRARTTIGELVDEGTVRYGNATISVKNPCPPGTAHFEPPPLPGRRAK
jgi:hypothetical protein